MLTVRPLAPEHLAAVLANPWRTTAEEMATTARLTGMEVGAWIVANRDERHSHVVHHEDDVLCCYGATGLGGADWGTWFMAAAAIEPHLLGVTRLLRRFIADQLAAHPGARLLCCSLHQAPEARRWFEFLGFEPVTPAGTGVVYVYRR